MSNTTRPLNQLIHDPHAILLENALIETDSKLNLAIPRNLQAQSDPGAYIVQARGPIGPDFLAALAAAGATIVSYIPNDAYLVRATAAVANGLASSPFVQAVLPYEPYYKVQSPLLAMAQEPLPQDMQLNLGLFADNAAATIQQIEKLGGILLSEENSLAGYPIIKVKPPANWTAIAQLPGVHVVEPFYRRNLANDLARYALGVSVDYTAPTNYMNLYGSNVIVEVNDSGIDTNHPDFLNPDRIICPNLANGIDTDGHGTHVAGIIAGSGLLSPAVTNASGSPMPGTNLQFRGKAPFARLLSMSYGDSDQHLQEAAAETNALISNNSWDYGADYDYDLAAASYDAATRDALPAITGSQPVCFVFSAGNEGEGNAWGIGGNLSDTIDSPATAKDVITVGAIEEDRYITNSVTNFPVAQPWLGLTQNPYSVPGFSSSGNVGIGIEGTYGRFKPDVVAPGTMVVSCRSTEWDTNSYYNPTNNTYYDFSDLIQTDSVSPAPFQFFVPGNAINVIIYTVTNLESPPVLPVIPIYLSTNQQPYAFVGTNDVQIAPSPNTLNSDWSVEASNITSSPLSYDLIVDVQTTNNYGNFYQVLENMNNTLCSNVDGIFPYRYESGTSMSAAAISGFLALIQDYFTNQLSLMPSPALLKAMTVNGARITASTYDPQPHGSVVNFEGWGLPDLSNSVPVALTNLPAPGNVGVQGPPCSTFFRDQNISNALATGDSETFIVNLNTNDDGLYQNLQVTLAWTDPPGDPVAALKLVNSLELVVTDLDDQTVVYYGNDIGPNTPFNTVESATNAPVVDSINNVQNIFIQPFSTNHIQPDADYSITVIGNRVNVNAVTQQTNNIVQDFALVISSGDMGAVTDAFTVTDEGIASNPTSAQNITVGQTNTILLNQIAGANTPLLGTNTIEFTTNTVDVGTNGQFTAGMTNQWHFYIVTNNTLYANAAFITFGANTLSLPRMGVFANSDDNSTTPGADIDLLVTRSSADFNASNLLFLDPVEISNCVNGSFVNGAAVGDGAALGSGGTDFVAYTNAQPGEVFYIGVKSENQQAVEYSFIPIFSQNPFGGLDQNGNEYLNALNVPQPIPDGTPSRPGVSYVFSIALFPIEIQNVVVTNVIFHQNFGSLVGSLTHNGNQNTAVVLNNHDSINAPGTYYFYYDDSGQYDPGTRTSDGPGSLRNFDGTQAQGVWQLTEEGTTLGQTGEVESSSIFLQKYQNPRNGIVAVVQPGQWFYTYVDVPPGVTNMQLYGAYDVDSSPSAPFLQMYLNTGSDPTFTSYLFEADLTNPPPAPIPSPFNTESDAPVGPWNVISDGPPLLPGTYYIGVYNPNTVAETVYLLAVLNGPTTVPQPTLFSSTNSVPILNDAVTNAAIFVNNSNTISSANVGFVVQYPRISDLAFTLVSPGGQRILLMQNRGGPLSTNAGGVFYITNSLNNVTANGSYESNINVIAVGTASGSLTISYDMFTIPDQMTVYYGNNPANFVTNATPSYLLYNSGMVSGTNTVTVTYPPPGVFPGYTNITIIMNQFGNTNATSGDAWTYSVNGIEPDFNYLTFTSDTNLTVTPIKFAIPPFDLRDLGTNYTFGDLDFATNGDYFGQSNIYDPYGGWSVPTNLVAQTITNILVTNNYNEVSVVADPAIAFNGSNYLALGYGVIQRTNYVTPYRLVSFSYEYRGPAIAGWWRGEGNANDSSDAEQRGQNGSLIGQFNFPAGEVGQSFQMENNGSEFNFAGTNGYVQIRQQPIYIQVATNSSTNLESGVSGTETVQTSYLDVGTGPGLTVEGWINPTNVDFQQPLVEWLARVPTNGSDTNLCIRAGPFYYPGTGHYYYLLAPTNWTTSETWAEQLGGNLATVASANAQNWIYDTFANYHGKNHNLWIGLTNTIVANGLPGDFGYSSGYTNVVYTNWLASQPTNCDGTRDYTLILGSTNIFLGVTNLAPGLWALADNEGTMCGPVSNIVYGVVEVPALQTNGVQFWISITNVPDTTNLILTNTGCLFADLVDVSNASHWIWSAPGLIQSNVFQHVALTYDTNSGFANLFYNGTNVASTNLGVFVPKTTGDVLLGKALGLPTTNDYGLFLKGEMSTNPSPPATWYFGGLMDEMSIYGRALSDAEIQAIYSVSTYSSNRLVGKFDPTITPPLNLAEARIAVGGVTNTILGENDQWQQGTFSFITQTNALPMQITGVQPGMLFDSFGFSQAPLGNLYYQPEQSLDDLKGENAYGNWTLEIWNTRLNALATNVTLLSWQLQMILETNTPAPLNLGFQEPARITILPGQIVSLAVTVPNWATVATNILDSSTQPLNVFFDTNQPPAGINPPNYFLFSGTSGSATVGTNVLYAPTNIIQGQTYYIGLQNTGSHAASAVFEVDFDITALTNDVPYNDTLSTTVPERYFSFTVASTNAYEATFQLLKMDGNADLVVSKGTPLPTLTSADYGSFNSGNASENIYVLTNSAPVPLSAGTWYLGVFNRDTRPVNYTVVAQELDMTSTPTNVTIIPLANAVPLNFTAGPGAALTNFFSFTVSNVVTLNTNGVLVTNSPPSVQFQLYNLTGNGDLTVQTDAPPFAPPFFQSSQEPGTLPEFIFVRTNNVLTNLVTTWYLGVPNDTSNLINYTILAIVNTNAYFPAFPDASGAGGGALGGGFPNGFTNNTVYHVVNLNDSGPGSLRDAVSSTNRTIIFDISGVIYLQDPLVITNSYLTIAGQTAPEGGITIADAPMIVSSYAHDDVIRYLRLRPNYMVPQQNLFVVDWYDPGTVNEFSPDGTYLGGYGPGNYQSGPEGISFDANTNLYIAVSGFYHGATPALLELDPAGNIMTLDSSLSSPSDVAVDKSGNLFVSDSNAGSVYKYTTNFVKTVFASGLAFPLGITLDSAGNLYVADQTAGNIYKYTPNGVRTTFYSGLSQPYGLAFSPGGNLFVSETTPVGNLFEITPGGVGTIFATNFPNFNFIAFNNAGNLFAANNVITEVTPIGTESTFYGDTGILGNPTGVAVGPSLSAITQAGYGAYSLEFNTASNVIADHVSLEWATNADLAIFDSTNVTVQWSVISDSILSTNTPAGEGMPTNGVGSIVDTAQNPPGGGAVSLNHNLYADNAYGNPQLGGNATLDFADNVIYDWGTNAGASDNATTVTNYLNYICNYLIASPTSRTNDIAFWAGTNTWIFQKDNFIDSDTNGVLNGANTGWNMFTNLYMPTNQFSLPPAGLDEAYQAYEKDLDFAGVSMFKRDAVDSNIVENVRTQTGSIIAAPGILPTESTNLIYQYSAQDGIPDFWKITFSQSVTNSYNNIPDSDGSGYSELEEFDNWLASPHALTTTNTPVGVNLQKMFGKTGNLSFYLTNAINGTVYLTNVLGSYTNTSMLSNTIAIFTPTNGAAGGTNYSGFASFDVYVTNNDTVAYFGPVTVSVFVSAAPPTYSEQAGYLPLDLPETNSIGPNTTIWYLISVPTNALAATNSLLFAGAPMNLWYSSNSPPTTAYPSDFELLANSTNGSAVINVSGAPLPPVLLPGGSYYLGVQNTNNFATNYAVEVTFYTPTVTTILHPGQPVTNTVPDGIDQYTVFVPPNAIAATNTILWATNGSINLYFNQTNAPLSGYPGDYELISEFTGMTPTNAVLTTNGVPPPPLVPGQPYYLAVYNDLGPGSVTYSIVVNFEYYYTPPVLPTVTNMEVVAGNTLTVDDQGSDTNAGTLYYYLTTAPPVNASISGSGFISWAVPTNTPGENVLFTTIVSNSFTAQTATNSFTVTVVPLTIPGQPQTNTVASNDVNWIEVNVPVNAEWATNILLYATNLPVNVLFTTNYPPSTNNAYTLMFDQTNGVSVLGLGTVPTNIVSGGTYYLGVENTNDIAVNYSVEVDFGYYSPPTLPSLTNQFVVAGNTLDVTNTAMDSNPGPLLYSLATLPAVSAVISGNGVISWAVPTNTPGENVLFTTVVSNSFTTQTATNSFTVTVIPLTIPSRPQTNTVASNDVSWIEVNVPVNAEWATNILLYATNLPVNVLFATNYPPSTNGAYTLMFDQTNGVSVLGAGTVPTNIVSGGTYYLGVQNTNGVAVNYSVQVNFGYYSPPALPVLTNRFILAGSALAVTNTATDLNPGTLAYSLATSPAVSAAISANGIITWATTTNQSPGKYVFTTIVTNSFTTESATNSFTVTVIAPLLGGQPQTNIISANSINWQVVTVPANAIWATNTLLYASNLPVNVLFTTNYPPSANGAYALMSSQTNGVSLLSVVTAPTNIVRGGVYYLGVQNTNNVPVNYALLVNFGFLPSPAFVHVGIVYTNFGGTNGFLLTWFAPTNDIFQVQETPVINPPVTWNTFSNTVAYAGPVTPTNGLFRFFDNGLQYPFGPARCYRLLLIAGTPADKLLLPVQTNYVLTVAQPLTVTNTAADSNPIALLNYNLSDFPNPAASPAITTNGIITWTPGPADAGSAYTFTTIASDNGVPPASATNAFTVFVLPAPAISNVLVTATNVTLNWVASTNDLFQVQWTTNLVPVVVWQTLSQPIPSPTGTFTFTDTNPPTTMKFYRLLWLPPQ